VPYQVLNHTADLRLQAEGGNLRDLFRASLGGLMAVLQPRYRKRPPLRKRKIRLKAPEPTALLVDFLGEVLSLSDLHREGYLRVAFSRLATQNLTAVLTGKAVDSFGREVKAVTYHEAEVKQNKEGIWTTKLVLDI
jgi:SHS2 domain-containing protein